MESIRIDNEEGILMNSRTEFGANSVPRINVQQPSDSTRRIRETENEKDTSADVPNGNQKKRPRTETHRDTVGSPIDGTRSARNTPGHQNPDPPASDILRQCNQEKEPSEDNREGHTESTDLVRQRNTVMDNLSPTSNNFDAPRTIRNQAELGLLCTFRKKLGRKSGNKQ